MLFEGELAYLSLKARDAIWMAFDTSFQEAVKDATNEVTNEKGKPVELDDYEKINFLALNNFESNLKNITSRQADEFIAYHMDILKSICLDLMDFPQEIAWSYIRSKYGARGNLVGFREADHIVTFQKWYYNMFNSAASRFL